MADIPTLTHVANDLFERSKRSDGNATDAEKKEAQFFLIAAHAIRDAIIELTELRGRARRK